MAAPAPTIDDLRVRLCYICRDEEAHGDPAPRRWVHPCACTLIAHETCLLRWIETAQSTARTSASSTARDALKCPQCNARFALESNSGPLLRVLDAANRAVSRAGKLVALGGIGALGLAGAGGVFVLLSSYGAFAVREFYGPAYYDLHLGEDASVWPWQVWLALPVIPLSLISSRIPGLPSLPTALLLPWPALFPPPTLSSAGRNWAATPAARAAPVSSALLRRVPLWPLEPAPLWPPSPALLCAAMPFVGAAYRRMRVRLEIAAVDVSGAQRLHVPAPLASFLRALGLGAPDAPVAAAPVNDEPPPLEPEANDEAAARVLRVTGASLGRVLGGALALPTIARLAGALLLRLSAHSALLARVLAAKPAASAAAVVYEWELGAGAGGVIGAIQRAARMEGVAGMSAGGAALVFGRMVVCGHRAWADGDPVWWRNALGLGLFVLAKDALRLLHLRLAAQELQSRRLKDRDFAGIDPKELDLVRPWPVEGRGIGVARA